MQSAAIAQPLGHDAAGGRRDVDADPLPAEMFRGLQCGAASAESVKNDVVGVAGGFDDSIQERERLLGGISKGFLGLRVDGRDVLPDRIKQDAFLLIEIPLQARHSALLLGPVDAASLIHHVELIDRIFPMVAFCGDVDAVPRHARCAVTGSLGRQVAK